MSAISQYHARAYHRLGSELQKISDSATFVAWLGFNPDARITPVVRSDGRITFTVVQPSRYRHSYFYVFYSAQEVIEHAFAELAAEVML